MVLPRSSDASPVLFSVGFAWIIAFVVSVQDYYNSFFGPLAVSYNPAAQIVWDVFESRLGDGRYATSFWGSAWWSQRC